MRDLCRIGLGTVQFGLPYGISNTTGRTPLPEVRTILRYAGEQNISLLDTASAYGDAEAVLGACLPEVQGFRLVTKISNALDAAEVERNVRSSLDLLKQRSLYGVLFHDAGDLLSERGEVLWNALVQIKERGVVEKIGASVYSPDEAERLMERYSLDIMQIPVNVFDQRFFNKGHMLEMKKRGIEIHARSCFLQGLLLVEPHMLSSFFEPVKGLLNEFRYKCDEYGCSPLDAALAFVFSVEELNTILVGVNSLAHLQDIVCSLKNTDSKNLPDFKLFSIDTPEIVEPRHWPRKK